MALGRWLGDYLGEWSGEDGGSSPAYVDAGFFVGGAGAAELRAGIAIDAALYAYGIGASSIFAALSEAPKPDVVDCWGGAWGAVWGQSWGKTRIEEYARSGYWRLFYYQLQEKSLQSRTNEDKVEPSVKVRFVKPETARTRARVIPEPEKLVLLKSTEYHPEPLPLSIFDLGFQPEFTFLAKHDKVVKPSVREEASNDSNDDDLLLLLVA